MRLWSIHPKYLDAKGLVALWREGLLAQAVLAGETKGYKHHPQLRRFLDAPDPRQHLTAYLWVVQREAAARGYRFDGGKLAEDAPVGALEVARGQLEYEWARLRAKVEARAPGWLEGLEGIKQPDPHPAFRIVEGGIAPWEVVPR